MGKNKKRARHSGIDECYWDRLDNAAKLFPAITDTRSPNVFRISAVFKEDIRADILQAATEQAVSIMPSFAVKLHRGLFWYYFDVNAEKPLVKEDHLYPCAPIYRAGERGFLFRVTYYKKRINFELYHALSDGMGAMSFMRLIVYCYCNRLYGDIIPEEFIRREATAVSRDFDEDSFVVNVSDERGEKKKKKKEPEAYRINGYRYDGTRLGILGAHIPAHKLLALSRSHGATLSEYICALLIWSIYNTSYRRSPKNRPIVISIPVNLRGMFESQTLRNFFGHMSICVYPTRDTTFEFVLNDVRTQFKKCMTKSYFEDQISAHVNIERIPGIKFVPLPIKNLVMRIIYRNTEKRYTMTFSNIGRLQLPDAIGHLVERFDVLIGGSRTHTKKASLCTYNDELSLVFSSTIDDNSLERFLITYLIEQGIEVEITSNETPMPPKPARDEVRAEKAVAKADKRSEKASKKQAKKNAKDEAKAAKKSSRSAKKQAKKQKKDKKGADKV